jgi:hypothetical protein
VGGFDAVPISKASCTDVGRAGKRGRMDEMQVAAGTNTGGRGTSVGKMLRASGSVLRLEDVDVSRMICGATTGRRSDRGNEHAELPSCAT